MPLLVLAMPCVQWCNLFQVRGREWAKIHEFFLFNEKMLHLVDDIFLYRAGHRQILRDGWVHYLSQKNAAGGPGQSARRVETAMRDKIVVDDELQMKRSFCGSQAVICPVERLPSPRCATVPCESFWKWSKPTKLLLALSRGPRALFL